MWLQATQDAPQPPYRITLHDNLIVNECEAQMSHGWVLWV
jgi:hypothetical protein